MARALTRKGRNGRTYKRPEEVEIAIDAVLKLDLEVLLQGAWVTDPQYERTLKSVKRYERILEELEAEYRVDWGWC